MNPTPLRRERVARAIYESMARVVSRGRAATWGSLSESQRAPFLIHADRAIAVLASNPPENTDPLMATTLHWCSECEGVSSEKAWDAAWWEERSRRMGDREAIAEMEWSTESSSTYGLAGREVCPRCAYVHADDDCSAVEEVRGFATAFRGDPENEIEAGEKND